MIPKRSLKIDLLDGKSILNLKFSAVHKGRTFSRLRGRNAMKRSRREAVDVKFESFQDEKINYRATKASCVRSKSFEDHSREEKAGFRREVAGLSAWVGILRRFLWDKSLFHGDYNY